MSMARETMMTPRVKEILGWYSSENPGVLSNLRRFLCTGNLAGTGKMVILPVDQGFEHGPGPSFAKNPPAYDPLYHYDLAIEAGCNGYAAPLGSLSAGAAEYAGRVPLILKLNNSDMMFSSNNPVPAITGSVKDALQLGCAGVGFTIYPGSSHRKEMYQEIREITREAKDHGLAVFIWSYPRGEGLSKAGETAVDVIAYAAQVACQLGAHVVKVKAPSEHIELDNAKKAYEENGVQFAGLADRTKHVIQSALNGRRIVIFSGGAAKGDEAVLEEIRGLAAGGSFGSIVGRNSFQRPKDKAITLLETIQSIYKESA